MLGPVQVLVVGADGPAAAETVLTTMATLRGEVPVRCLDAFVVEVGDDGGLEVGSTSPSVALFAREDEQGERAGDGSTWSLADVVPPGSSAVVVLLEHRWAIGLRDTLLSAGAVLAHESWLDEQDRAELEALLPH